METLHSITFITVWGQTPGPFIQPKWMSCLHGSFTWGFCFMLVLTLLASREHLNHFQSCAKYPSSCHLRALSSVLKKNKKCIEEVFPGNFMLKEHLVLCLFLSIHGGGSSSFMILSSPQEKFFQHRWAVLLLWKLLLDQRNCWSQSSLWNFSWSLRYQGSRPLSALKISLRLSKRPAEEFKLSRTCIFLGVHCSEHSSILMCLQYQILPRSFVEVLNAS